jgi:hypothetical protein
MPEPQPGGERTRRRVFGQGTPGEDPGSAVRL